MKTVYIGFSTNNQPLARLIRFLTRSSVSHTYFRVPTYSITGRSWIFQASGLAVNLESDNHFLSHARVVQEFELDLTEDQFADLETFMIDSAGKPYSVCQLLGMSWVLLGRVFGAKWKNPCADGDHSYICVELVAKILHIPAAEEMTPEDLLEWVRSHLKENEIRL